MSYFTEVMPADRPRISPNVSPVVVGGVVVVGVVVVGVVVVGSVVVSGVVIVGVVVVGVVVVAPLQEAISSTVVNSTAISNDDSDLFIITPPVLLRIYRLICLYLSYYKTLEPKINSYTPLNYCVCSKS